MHPDPRRIVPVVLVLGLIAAFFWYRQDQANQAANGALSASGTIEATEVRIAAEASGRVLSVSVVEGESVKAGDVLVELDDSLLQAQRLQAEAGLKTARANQQAAGRRVPRLRANPDRSCVGVPHGPCGPGVGYRSARIPFEQRKIIFILLATMPSRISFARSRSKLKQSSTI